MHSHARFDQSGAAGGRTAPPLDLDQAHPAGPESLDAIGRTEAGVEPPHSAAARITLVPAGTVTSRQSMRSVTD